MTDRQVMLQLQQLPESLKQEVLDFIGFLSAKYKNSSAKSPLSVKVGKPAFGCGTVKVTLAQDFDEPLEDFKEYM